MKWQPRHMCMHVCSGLENNASFYRPPWVDAHCTSSDGTTVHFVWAVCFVWYAFGITVSSFKLSVVCAICILASKYLIWCCVYSVFCVICILASQSPLWFDWCCVRNVFWYDFAIIILFDLIGVVCVVCFVWCILVSLFLLFFKGSWLVFRLIRGSSSVSLSLIS